MPGQETSSDLKALGREIQKDWTIRYQDDQGATPDTFTLLGMCYYHELTKPSDKVIQAMLETSWPESMTPHQQMAELLKAAVVSLCGDVVLSDGRKKR